MTSSVTPDPMTLENAALRVTFAAPDATLHVLDKRMGQTWAQKPAGLAPAVREVRAFALPDGARVAPSGYHVAGM